ncbi:MAG: TonB family protein [Candidatus Riflebacteria bacterium]|nr:TonB family protein [Candidatus Riflebacteria bacterium]
MKILKQIKNRSIEGIDELQLSMLIHLFLLLILTVYFAIYKTEIKKLDKISVPIKLFAAAEKPKAGSVAEVKNVSGAKPAKGNSQKAIKTETKTAKKVETKAVKTKTASVAKPKKKAAPKSTANKVTQKKAIASAPKTETKKIITKNTEAKPNTTIKKTDISSAKTTAAVVPIKVAEDAKPVVVQNEPVQKNEIIKPTHITPSFDVASDYTVTPSMSTPLSSEISDSMFSTEISEMLMPDSMFENEMEEVAVQDYFENKTGIEETSDTGSGIFSIGSIEAFGGNNDNFSAPGIVKRVEPDYPDWARQKGVHGNAVYRVLILPSGTVGDVVTMSSTIDPKLAINGAQSLRRWIFTPVLINGEPQETWVKITVQYELN